jgi:hypothetical protein
MIEIILGSLAVILILSLGWLAHLERVKLAATMVQEGDLMKENLDHIAGALVGLSELLGDAEDVVADVQRIPSVGEVLMQMGTQLLMNKLAPTIEPFAGVGVIPDLMQASADAPTQSQTEDPPT